MENSWFTNEFAKEVWSLKYAGRHDNIASYFRALAELVADDDQELYEKFFELLVHKKFSPGGRILAWVGRDDAKVSLMNCTTHAIEDDSIEGITKALYRVTRSSSRGQGIGLDLSKLRPAEAPVNNSAITSTGAISFMELLNHAGSIIGQNGRRAALLFSLNVDHPDIWRPDNLDLECGKCLGKGCMQCKGKGRLPYDFLNVKKVSDKVNGANISVNVSDDFMEAVRNDNEWTLKFRGQTGGEDFVVNRKVKAKDLMRAIARSAYMSAEPGLLFTDNTRRMSNSDLFGERWKVTGVNACSEQHLDQDGVCNLGSMNMAAYVINPFTEAAYFDFDQFGIDVQTAIAFLDRIVDIEISRGYSISPKQREALENLRRIGLGIMGYADALAMLGIEYSYNAELIDFTTMAMSRFRDNCYIASVNLAIQNGPAPLWERLNKEAREKIVSSAFFSTLPITIRNLIVEYGTRNITLTSVAPTGSISNWFGVSSGIEPLFALEYTRRTRMSGKYEYVNYVHPAVIQARELGISDKSWKTAYQVTPREHVMIQGLIQGYIDQSISKTINMPGTSTVDDVLDVYTLAHELGIKGITVYVNGSRDEQILYNSTECPECKDEGHVIEEGGCRSCTVCGWSVCT